MKVRPQFNRQRQGVKESERLRVAIGSEGETTHHNHWRFETWQTVANTPALIFDAIWV